MTLSLHRPFAGFSEVSRYKIVSILDWQEFSLINTDFSPDSMISFNDFDRDGRKDYALGGDDRIVVLSSQKPLGFWLSPLFPLGFPLFIINFFIAK